MNEIQRTRMLTAMAEVACERGAGDASVAHVVERAGVSRRTFYELFEDREDCFVASLKRAIELAGIYVSARDDLTADWAERVRLGLQALFSFLEHEPVLGRLAVVESLSAGSKALEVRCTAIARLVASVDAGRASMNGSSTATELTGEGVVGGALAVIHGRLLSTGVGDLAELVNPLMSMIVLPYLGPSAAREELEQPTPKSHRRVPVTQGNPLKELNMRLTYRTVRALAAVAANPGSSNRLIGNTSGIGDQGQVSKLLARMEKLGLVENTRTGSPRGATNAWNLTERGEEVSNVITTRATAS